MLDNYPEPRRVPIRRRPEQFKPQFLPVYISTNYLSLTLLIALIIPPSHLVQSFQFSRQHPTQDDPETMCLSCIRSVTSIGIESNKRCEGGYFCGPFQFSYQYWAESGKPGNSQGIRDFEKCARDKQCAEQTVRAYFKKFKRDCNGDGQIDCHDMAALHKAGPGGCASDWFYKSRYWSTFNKTACALRRDPVTTIASDRNDSLFGVQQVGQRQVLMKNQTLTTECLDCICEALSSCGATSANNCGSGLVCGPFAISQSYWKDGRRPGASWTACARTKECSSVTIRNYMDKYKRDCNSDGYLTCEDYAAIHRRGPMSCTNRDLLKEQYWTRFLTCRANQKPSNDANLVKLDDASGNHPVASRGDSAISPADLAPLTNQPVRINNSISNLLLSQVASTLATVITTTISPSTSSTTTTTTTTTTISTTTQAPSTRHRPAYYETNEQQDSSNVASTSGVADLNPTYELSPVLPITKATSNQAKNYQTTKASHDAYDKGASMLVHPVQDSRYEHPSAPGLLETSESSLPARSNPSTPAQVMDYFGPQITQPVQTYQEAVQRRPVIDYSSLPTIIVSKRIESPSVGRISQPPPLVSIVEIRTPMVTSSMTMTALPSSSTTFSYPEATTTFTSNSDSTINHSQQGVNFAPPSASSELGDQNLDYPLTDFANNGPGVDRASFDRVVNGIVANPDFSKSHPPVPENMGQRKNSMSQSPLRGLQRESTLTTKSAEGHTSSSAPAAASGLANRRENSKTLPPNIYNTLENEHQSRPDGENLNSATLVGPNALNMSTLFEKGLNESSRIASECLDCICDASSNCDSTVQCISKQREKNRCGLYMISWNQYKESDISLTTLNFGSTQSEDSDEKLYYECTTDKNCAERLIHLYIEKYQKDCNLDGKIDCYDIAAIHRVGPESCNSNKFLSSQYWRDFSHCYSTDRLTTTVMPQSQVSQGS